MRTIRSGPTSGTCICAKQSTNSWPILISSYKSIPPFEGSFFHSDSRQRYWIHLQCRSTKFRRYVWYYRYSPSVPRAEVEVLSAPKYGTAIYGHIWETQAPFCCEQRTSETFFTCVNHEFDYYPVLCNWSDCGGQDAEDISWRDGPSSTWPGRHVSCVAGYCVYIQS